MKSVIICWIILIILVGAVTRKGYSKGTKRGSNRINISNNVFKSTPSFKMRPPVKSKHEVDHSKNADSKFKHSRHEKSSIVSDSMEDRQNDWLAKQMREERRLLEKGDLLDLGASHSAHCAAKDLKRKHILEHDDSVDTGEAKYD